MQSAFEFKFVEFPVVQTAETRRKAAKIADERNLRRDHLNDGKDTSLLSKLQAFLGFALCVDERVSRREQIGV